MKRLVTLGLGLGLLGLATAQENKPTGLFVLGVDGMDPVILQRLMNEGSMPNFSDLSQQGGFVELQTSTPPQSPVAWSNFITGTDPGDAPPRDPDTDDSRHLHWFESINVTHLASAYDLLTLRGTTFLQEHSIPKARHRAWFRRARRDSFSLYLGPTDPEARSDSCAGVGFCAPLGARIVRVSPLTDAFRQAVALGRADCYRCHVGSPWALSVFCIYGWQGGHTCAGAAKRTSELVVSIIVEAAV